MFSHVRRAVVGATALAVALGTATVVPAAAQAATPAAPLLAAGAGNAVPGRYIVVLKRPDQGLAPAASVDALARTKSTARSGGGTVRREFTAALRGFSADLPPAALDALRHDPAVAYVEADEIHRQPTTAVPHAAQTSPPWDLDRIDQHNLPLDNSYTAPNDAAGVNVYVLDSGVRATNTDFEGRATGVFSAINDGNGTNDCADHGTLVSSLVAGRTYGAAKKSNIKMVRILHCDNTASTEEIVDGMNWTTANAPAHSVVNMSIQSAGGNQALDDAATAMVDHGLLMVFIAGNFNVGDCSNSPKDPRAIIMAATAIDDSRNTGPEPSSFGPCVTAFAPGADVTGAGDESDTSVLTGWYGTSFAAPLASATVAMALHDNPNLTMAQAKDLITNTATTGVLSNIGAGSPNRLLFVGSNGGSGQNPVVTNPGSQTSTANAPVSLAIHATDPQNDPLTYTATGLPAGLTINANTGTISGTPTTAGISTVTVVAHDPAGNTGSATFSWKVAAAATCTPTQLVGNGGFESGTTPWTGNTGTIGQFAQEPAHGGTRVAALDGYGHTATEGVAQTVTIPAGCSATLTYFLHIDTAETGTTAFDTMTVKLGGTTLSTFSNADAAPGYTARTVDVSSFAGQTVTLAFSGTEDASLQTSFVLDDVTINTR